MFKSLIPNFSVRSVFELTPELLQKHGIKLLLTDLDNTLAPYSGEAPSDELIKWKSALESADIDVFVVSNTKSERARQFSVLWGVPYINRARKPRPDAVIWAAESMNRTRRETVLVGDQIFTDVWAANRAGVVSIITRPLILRNILFILRYIAELPFRAFAENIR